MDNQQVRRACELAWFAGIFDGEGCISFGKRSRGDTYEPVMQINNQDPYVIETASRILSNEGLPHWVSPAYKNTGNTKAVRASGFKRCKQWLVVLTPWLVSKKHEALLLLQFIASREQRPRNASWTEEEWEIFREIRQLKQARNLRDYTPDPEWPPRVKI